jgi:hypothetical protein
MHKCLPLIRKEIVQHGNGCLDDAIRSAWPAYRQSSPWTTPKAPDSTGHWLCSHVAPYGDMSSLSFHFNLLTAQLLVNGLPLARLPSEYEAHALYPVLFGRATVEVVPPFLPGMQFSAKKPVSGYIVAFSSWSAHEVVLTATADGQIFDLLPASLFVQKLPEPPGLCSLVSSKHRVGRVPPEGDPMDSLSRKLDNA